MKHLKLTFLLAVLMSMVGAKLFAYDANVNGIYYNLSDNEATVTYYSLYESQNKNAYYGIIEIPSFIIYNEKTYNVTSIGEQAFFGCSGLTSVTIPNSVTSINRNAFENCRGLTSVTIPNSVTSIGAAAFSGCTGLTSVIIPESVTTIGSSAFNSCSALASINFPNSLISVGGAAFDETGWYNNQPDGVVYAGKVVYKYKGTMPSNTSITLKKGTVGITVDAFYSSSGLTSINIPNSVTYISDGAFVDCNSLTSIDIPESVLNIGNYVFMGCNALSSINFPNSSLMSVGQSAFEGTAWFDNQLDGVVYAGKVAYKYKGTMPVNTSIALNEGTLGIAYDAFSRCSELISITFPNSLINIGFQAFSGCNGLTSITIPNSVTSIGNFAFSSCSGLTSITIPKSVTNIGFSAFAGSNSLTSVNVMNPTPVEINSVAFSNRANATLYVPAGSKAAYEAADYWKEFKEIVEIVPRTEQTLALSELPTLTVGDAPYELPATTHEGLALSWSVGDNTIAEITEGKLIAKAVGETTVTATQAGNDEYLPFTREFTLTVNEAEQPQGVDVTDISQLDNVIYMDETEVRTGREATLSLKMKNTAAIRGFQFDLYLPNGLTVVKSSKGKIQGALCPDRLPDEDEHDLTFSQQPDGAIRFLCSSQYDETFTGNDGEIATLKVNVAADMTDGEYPILLKNIKLTETNISKYYTAELIQSKLIAVTYMTGDINNDDVVDVSDYTGIANHIHGNTPVGFNAIAADVDKNGTVDVSDYTGIANIIHTGSIYGNSSNSARATGNQPTADWDAKDNVIFIAPFTATAGTKTAISIEMKNTAAIRGFQFDLYLPEGMTVVKSAKGKIQGKLSEGRLPDEDEHDLTFSQQADGAIRFLCSSQYDETFTGTSGELATLQVEIASDMANGDHAIQLKNMKLTETDISKYYTSDLIESTVTIEGGATTGIIAIDNDQLTNANEAGAWYTIDGRRLTSKPAKSGLYIKNGKKVVIE